MFPFWSSPTKIIFFATEVLLMRFDWLFALAALHLDHLKMSNSLGWSWVILVGTIATTRAFENYMNGIEWIPVPGCRHVEGMIMASLSPESGHLCSETPPLPGGWSRPWRCCTDVSKSELWLFWMAVTAYRSALQMLNLISNAAVATSSVQFGTSFPATGVQQEGAVWVKSKIVSVKRIPCFHLTCLL